MAFAAIYIPEFSFSADYPKKLVSILSLLTPIHNFCRVLVATIRDLGQCPCPCCCIPKAKLIAFATLTDMEDRQRLARHNTAERQAKVLQARSLIYDQGYAVNSAKVDELLKNESLVPTIVSLMPSSYLTDTEFIQECIFFFAFSIWPGFLFVVSCGLDAWDWAWGVESLTPTSCSYASYPWVLCC